MRMHTIKHLLLVNKHAHYHEVRLQWVHLACAVPYGLNVDQMCGMYLLVYTAKRGFEVKISSLVHVPNRELHESIDQFNKIVPKTSTNVHVVHLFYK